MRRHARLEIVAGLGQRGFGGHGLERLLVTPPPCWPRPGVEVTEFTAVAAEKEAVLMAGLGWPLIRSARPKLQQNSRSQTLTLLGAGPSSKLSEEIASRNPAAA